MGYFLLEHELGIQQYRYPRRAPISGMVGVHSTESIMDDVGPDTGPANVADFIARRTDYGSYHEIVGSQGYVPMAPDDYETWHIAADLHNWHSWGISAACRSTDFDPDHPWTQATITIMGQRIAAFWERNQFDPHQCARWITREEALQHIPGLIHHGDAQPADRTDAWTRHPRRADLDQMLIDAILRAVGSGDEEDVTPALKDELDALRKDLLVSNIQVATAAAEHTIYLLANPDGKATPTYHMGNVDTGQAVNLVTVIASLGSIADQLQTIAQSLAARGPQA